ncbi:TetR/AcrR family transcriptional regulator [Arcobacter aquimarinus]|uniref:TetR/AcrR family transcriptional regulator n=1 Tax=Arcobacter aquimarinus TaxID=1315211 RepID=UPI002A13F72B|nr:TetR/AcrR family transcriptional regulator [Arcobacter sp.]
MKSKINNEINRIKRDLYLKQASEYFDKYGYKNFKISQLAKELETSVGTIYNLFNSKDDLYLEYLILKLQNFMNSLNEKETNNAYANLELYLSCKYEIFMQIDKNRDITIITDPYFFHKLDISNHKIVDEIYNFLIRQFKKIYPNSNMNYKHIAILFKKLSDGFIESYLLVKYDTKDVISDTMSIFFKGLEDKK